jgi:hypothetical protein
MLNIILNVIKLSVILLTVIVLSAIVLNVIMLSVINLSITMLNAIMLSVVVSQSQISNPLCLFTSWILNVRSQVKITKHILLVDRCFPFQR